MPFVTFLPPTDVSHLGFVICKVRANVGTNVCLIVSSHAQLYEQGLCFA
uniref:Uncharacterized protein n=1 Tax=Rhizophora mucronata TaxID=61149 RepID=A0A2P2Q5V8_RHIMU